MQANGQVFAKNSHKKPIHRQTSTINVSHHAGPRHTERPSSSKHIKDHYIRTKTVAMFTGCIQRVGVRGCTQRTKLPKFTCTQTLRQFLTFKRTQTTLGLTLSDNNINIYFLLLTYTYLLGVEIARGTTIQYYHNT